MASKMTVEPGRYIMVKHKGDREWHEFLVTAVVSGTAPRYVILTPDEDHYVLDLNGDVDELFLVGPGLRLPPASPRTVGSCIGSTSGTRTRS